MPFPQPLLLLLSSTHRLGPEAKALTLSMCGTSLTVLSLRAVSGIPEYKGLFFSSSQKQYLQLISSINSLETKVVIKHLLCARAQAVGQTQGKVVQVCVTSPLEGKSIYAADIAQERG